MIGSFFFCSPRMRATSSGVGPPPFRQQLDHVRGNADRLARVDQRPLDRLLDPVAGVRAKPRAHRRVEPFDRPQQPEVALLDEILQRQPLAGVAAGDVHDQSQIGPHHAIASREVALADPRGQLALVGGGQQGGFVDFAQIRFQRRLDRGAGSSAFAGGGHRRLSIGRKGRAGKPGPPMSRHCRLPCTMSTACAGASLPSDHRGGAPSCGAARRANTARRRTRGASASLPSVVVLSTRAHQRLQSVGFAHPWRGCA